MLRWFARRLNEARKDERGFTLIELLVVNARSISEGLWRMARYAHGAAESLDARIDGEELDGRGGRGGARGPGAVTSSQLRD